MSQRPRFNGKTKHANNLARTLTCKMR